jgi:hypothetical protein
MKRERTFAGSMALAAIIALSSLVVPTAEAGEQGLPAVLRLLDEILANQATLLERLQVPDLVPVPVTGVVPGHPVSSEPAGFCRFDAQGRLFVFVYNQGAGPAGPSVTRVSFRVPSGERPPGETSCGVGCAQVDVPTAGLTAYLGTNGVGIDVPVGCFGSAFGPDDINNCQFKIWVDATNVLNESNELNNGAFGACQGLL